MSKGCIQALSKVGGPNGGAGSRPTRGQLVRVRHDRPVCQRREQGSTRHGTAGSSTHPLSERAREVQGGAARALQQQQRLHAAQEALRAQHARGAHLRCIPILDEQ